MNRNFHQRSETMVTLRMYKYYINDVCLKYLLNWNHIISVDKVELKFLKIKYRQNQEMTKVKKGEPNSSFKILFYIQLAS